MRCWFTNRVHCGRTAAWGELCDGTQRARQQKERAQATATAHSAKALQPPRPRRLHAQRDVHARSGFLGNKTKDPWSWHTHTSPDVSRTSLTNYWCCQLPGSSDTQHTASHAHQALATQNQGHCMWGVYGHTGGRRMQVNMPSRGVRCAQHTISAGADSRPYPGILTRVGKPSTICRVSEQARQEKKHSAGEQSQTVTVANEAREQQRQDAGRRRCPPLKQQLPQTTAPKKAHTCDRCSKQPHRCWVGTICCYISSG